MARMGESGHGRGSRGKGANSPPDTGGVARAKRAPGWSLTNHVDVEIDHPVCAFGASTPPVSGGEFCFSLIFNLNSHPKGTGPFLCKVSLQKVTTCKACWVFKCRKSLQCKSFDGIRLILIILLVSTTFSFHLMVSEFLTVCRCAEHRHYQDYQALRCWPFSCYSRRLVRKQPVVMRTT